METKICKTCKLEKPTTDYYANKYTKDKLAYVCKSCWLIVCKERREKYPERVKKTNKEQYLKNREHRIKQANEYQKRNYDKVKVWRENRRKRNPRFMKEYDLKKKYNLSIEEYDKMLEKINYCCEICKSPFNDDFNYVDHCHKTGKVRGILCRNCNTSLGMLNENITILKSMISYIKRNRPLQHKISFSC